MNFFTQAQKEWEGGKWDWSSYARLERPSNSLEERMRVRSWTLNGRQCEMESFQCSSPSTCSHWGRSHLTTRSYRTARECLARGRVFKTGPPKPCGRERRREAGADVMDWRNLSSLFFLCVSGDFYEAECRLHESHGSLMSQKSKMSFSCSSMLWKV